MHIRTRQSSLKHGEIRFLIRHIESWIGSFFVSMRAVLIAFVLSGGYLSLPYLAQAAQSYEARTSGATIRLEPGESKRVFVSFTNIGTKTWTSGLSSTAVYLYGNSSVLGHAAWLKDDVPALIDQSSVGPGKIATASFWVKAPTKAGTYREKFLLSAGKNVWVKGSTVTIDFVVTGTIAPQVQQASVSTTLAPVQGSSVVSMPTMSTGSSEWKAELVNRGGIEWQMNPQDHIMVTLAFKNTGTRVWTREGGSFVSLYTGSDKRSSLFKDSSWKSDVQAAMLKEATVRPGEIGHIMLQLRAPDAPGMYQERFELASENTAWISGGSVTLPIRVAMPSNYIAKGIPNGVDPATIVPGSIQAGQYKAVLMLRSDKEVSLLGNGRKLLSFGFKNTGIATWNNLTLRISGVLPALSGKLSSVRDESWVNSIEPVNGMNLTAPGSIGFLNFKIKAPTKKGKYTASFRLYADGQPVDDGLIDIPITVTADGMIEPEPVMSVPTPIVSTPKPSTSAPSGPSSPSVPVVPLGGDVSSLPMEPIIRVGLFRTNDDQMSVRGVIGGFSVKQDGNVVCQFTVGETVNVRFDRNSKVYIANGPRCSMQSSRWYVVVSDDGIAPLEMTDFSRPVSWLPGANDNKFRSKLELRYTPATDGVWVINELLIESYLKGLAETSDLSPSEFQKTLMTAARTYAMYHVQRGTKHADEFYIVDATYDQVYRGYGAEARSPKIAAGVDATRGQIVTYQDKLAITPYFSRSDGRTRSWNEVWGGSYAWLMTVPVPQDNGKTLWGHGVGMSASGALTMANEGRNYQQILKHFYTGIELRQIYR